MTGVQTCALPIWGISTQLWKNHGIANGPTWALAIDDAEAQVYDQQARVLRAEAKKAKEAAEGAAGGAPPAAPGNGT